MSKLITIILLAMFSCSSPKNITNSDIKYISFGNGGGFVGLETKYTLNAEGTVTKILNSDSTILKEIDKKEVASFFNQADNFKTYKYFKPDNIYQFVEINNNRIVWGFTTDTLNPKLISLYNQLLKLTK